MAESQPKMLMYIMSLQSSSVAHRKRLIMAIPKPPKWNGSFLRKHWTLKKKESVLRNEITEGWSRATKMKGNPA